MENKNRVNGSENLDKYVHFATPEISAKASAINALSSGVKLAPATARDAVHKWLMARLPLMLVE
jgi:hypothetical protein